MRGSVVLETALGELEVGIREGTAAWLDLSTSSAACTTRSTAAEAPDARTRRVEVRARTSDGDIVIRRSRHEPRSGHDRPIDRATGLRKSFGDNLVLDGIDLDVAEGTVFALLGPNGAGKTTIVHILSTLIGADAGDVRVAGHDLAARPRRGARARSASPASSPPSTTCSPARRT